MEYSLFPDRKIPSQNLLSVFLSLKIKGADIHVSKLSLYSYQCALCKLQSSLQAHLKKGFTQWVVTRIYTQWFSTYGTRVAFGFLSEVWCRINLWSLLLHLSPLTSLFARLNHPRQACGEKKTVAALALIIFS